MELAWKKSRREEDEVEGEVRLNKDQRQTGGLSLRNGSLTQEIVQAERRLQDLWEDLAESETAHTLMRKCKKGASLCRQEKKKSVKAIHDCAAMMVYQSNLKKG